MRHLATADLWVQDRLRAGDFRLEKIPGVENPSDVLTKHVPRPLMMKHLNTINLRFEGGRAEAAPSIDHSVHSIFNWVSS